MLTIGYLYLVLAIITEVIGTSALKYADGFTNLIPSIIVGVSYGLSFYFLSLTLRTVPMHIAYALWAGLGIILITLISIVLFKELPNIYVIVGIACIVTGVVLINVFGAH